ncbi:MAG: F0F1 ATP synthase subunit epsilon [Caldilineae bacterium]|nr:MAG: F0F1 ATP synthase subunit epsilon [Caldilineae bacterium]
MSIHVEIVTPRRELFNGDVEMITLPGIEGQMGVMGQHAPLLTILDIGEIVLHREGQEPEYIAVSGGVVEVRPDKVIVLARSAERAEEIDVERALAAMRRAEESLRERPPEERRPVELALRRSRIRLKVAERRRRRRPGPPGMYPAPEEAQEQG